MMASRRNTAHDLFAEFHRHRSGLDDVPAATLGRIVDDDDEDHEGEEEVPPSSGGGNVEGGERASFEMFRNVMKTGVLYATSRAQNRGFKSLDDPEWANS